MMRTAVIVTTILALAACSKRAASTATQPDEAGTPWSRVGIGSVFESRTVTRLEQPFAHETETTTKQTLLARDAAEASVRLEVREGSIHSAQELKIPLQAAATPPCDGATVTTVDESCTVPAGTFDCTKTTVAIRQGTAARSTVTWTAKHIPVPIKSIVQNENMTTMTELTSVSAL